MNPFMVEDDMIFSINDPSAVLPNETFVTMSAITEDGQKQIRSFIQDRLLYQKVSIFSPIHKNNFDLWQSRQTQLEKHRPLSSLTIKKIFSAIELRQDLATTVFEFELNDVPYSLSSNPVSLYRGTKSDIINRLPNATTTSKHHTECKSAIILEMSPIIRANCLSLPENISCFNDVAVILYYEVLKQGSGYDRIDAVFDRYFDRSLKEATRIRRGTETRLKITELCGIPKNFESFLHVSQNKNDFNEYLAEKFISMHHDKETILTSHQEIVEINTEVKITECQSEEADQRLVRHTLHCLSPCFSFEEIVINTFDTDVLILLIANLSSHLRKNLRVLVYAEIVRSGIHHNLRAMILELDHSICEALSFFYAFSGCDTVSSFFSKEKCKGWDIWMEDRSNLDEVFIRLENKPGELTNTDMNIIEKFVTKMYTKQNKSLTLLRIELFKYT